MGAIDSVWFRTFGRESDDWYEAKYTGKKVHMSARTEDPVLVMPNSHSTDVYSEEMILRHVVDFMREYPKVPLNRKTGAGFIAGVHPEIKKYYPDLNRNYNYHIKMEKILWQAYGMPVQEELRSILFIEGARFCGI